MAKPILDDELWQIIEPLLPKPKRRRFRYPGRKPISNRQALTGILFVLRTGIAWNMLPQELGCGSGMTCLRRLHAWQKAGVWKKLHETLLVRLQQADNLDWSRAVVDSSSVRAIHGGDDTGANPTDRAKRGSKHHMISEAHGIPLAVFLTGANAHDLTQLKSLVLKIPPVRGKRGRPRQRPRRVQGDRGYDSEPHRQWLRDKGIEPVLAKRNTEHGSGLGVYRWVIERSLSWLHQNKRVRMRDDRSGDIHLAFLTLAAALICFNFL
jgi:transposase